jgi:hypothetical protein
MRCPWRRLLLWALIVAAFLRPFAQRAWLRHQSEQHEQPLATSAGRAAVPELVALADPSSEQPEPEPDPAAAQAAEEAAAAATAATAAAEASWAAAADAERGPPRWGPDRNVWWEDGLGLVPRRASGGRSAAAKSRIDVLVVVLSGRSAKYAARRETIRSTWSVDVAAAASKQKLNLKLVFAVSDNFCGYDPASLPPAATSFPAARCKQAHEHSAGGQVSDEHSALLAEYRKHKDVVFVPQTVDAYYTSATKMRTFYKCLIEAKVRENGSFEPFIYIYIHAMFLPRQARDTHRESAQKRRLPFFPQVSFGILIKLDDDGVIRRKPFFEHYAGAKNATF